MRESVASPSNDIVSGLIRHGRRGFLGNVVYWFVLFINDFKQYCSQCFVSNYNANKAYILLISIILIDKCNCFYYFIIF